MFETIDEKRRSVIGILAVNRRRDPQSRVPLELGTLQLTPIQLLLRYGFQAWLEYEPCRFSQPLLLLD